MDISVSRPFYLMAIESDTSGGEPCSFIPNAKETFFSRPSYLIPKGKRRVCWRSPLTHNYGRTNIW